MELLQLIGKFNDIRLSEKGRFTVEKISVDSNNVDSATLFVAIRGTKVDGHKFLSDVCYKKAVGIVVESAEGVPRDYRGAVIVVKNTRQALAEIASRFYGQPSEKLFTVAVTGTNGKTSITYMVEHLLQEFKGPFGVIGTIDNHLRQKVWPAKMTTPDPISFQERLREFVNLEAKGVAIEASSHALAQHRVDGTHFDVAIFTNLTRDHLDFHQTMESYFEAKQRLFVDLLSDSIKNEKLAVINVDDEWGRKLQVASNSRCWTYGQKNADFTFKILSMDFKGTNLFLQTPIGTTEAKVPVVGLHNVQNFVASLATACFAGLSLKSAMDRFQNWQGVPGRLQPVANQNGIHVFIDYAHTDDGLRSVLSALQQIRAATNSTSRISVVFGCGGDRDKGKRPLMMKAALDGADRVIATSDNPRTESPDEILRDVTAEVDAQTKKNLDRLIVEVDRRLAIEKALKTALPGEVIVIAGKGHEAYQEIGLSKLPFSDYEVAEQILRSL